MKQVAENTMKLKKTEYSLLKRLFLLIAMFGAISFGLANNSQAQSPTFTNNGPSAGTVNNSGSQSGGAIAFAPSNPNVIYLATDSNTRTLWRSSDGGTTWTDVNNGLPISTVNPNQQVKIKSIAVDPTNENIVYVGLVGGQVAGTVFKTTNGGANWNPSRLGLPDFFSIDTLGIHPSAPNIIYAGFLGMYRSTDGGATWSLRSSGMMTLNNQLPSVVSFAIAPSDPNRIYAETRNGLYKTINGGATWTQKTTEDYSFGEIRVHPTNPDILYMSSSSGSRLLKSTTGGETALTTITLPNGAGAWSVAIDPVNPETVYVGGQATFLSNYLQQTGVFKTTNGGTNWTQLRNGFPNCNFFSFKLNINPNNPSNILVGTVLGTFKTTNGGTDWQGITGIFDTQVQAIAYAPSDNNIAYVATFAGYFKTINRGASWTRINAPLQTGNFGITQAFSLAVSPINPNLVYAGLRLNGLFKSTDGGTTWNRTGAGIIVDTSVEKVYVDPTNEENVFCLTRTNGSATTTLYKSTDFGGSFGQLSLPSTGEIKLTFSSVTNIFYAAVNTSQAPPLGNLNVYRTTNGGFTWTPVFQRTNDRSGEVLLSPTDPNLIYVKSARNYDCNGFNANAPLIFRSTNGGTSFTQMASTGFAQNSDSSALGVDPVNGALYLTGNECSAPSTHVPGVLRSTDGGANWSLFVQSGAGGIPPATLFTSGIFSPTLRTFYLGTGGAGVFVGAINSVRSTPFDFDGDAKTDISIFRPNVGEWWINRSSSGQTIAAQFGNSSDKIVPGDFTGDGKTDMAFWRPVSGEWFILRSEDFSFFSFPFGASGDIPVPADYDGDGKTDPAVFRPSIATWFISKSSGGTIIRQFGTTGDLPAIADYDGDGKTDIAIFRPSDGSWWYIRSSDHQFRVFSFGLSSDKPVQGDYTGDGKADIAVFRPSTGEWFIQRSEDNSYFSFPFGANGDVPVPGDYDGDGRVDAGVFRPSSVIWFINRTTAGVLITSFGTTGDQPVPNAFVP